MLKMMDLQKDEVRRSLEFDDVCEEAYFRARLFSETWAEYLPWGMLVFVNVLLRWGVKVLGGIERHTSKAERALSVSTRALLTPQLDLQGGTLMERLLVMIGREEALLGAADQHGAVGVAGARGVWSGRFEGGGRGVAGRDFRVGGAGLERRGSGATADSD